MLCRATFCASLLALGCDNSPLPETPCPPSPPEEGAPCADRDGGVFLTCEYGPPARPGCTIFAICAWDFQTGGFGWTSIPPDPSCGPQPTLCPARFADVVEGTPCPVGDGVCEYDEGDCGCWKCEHTTWQCHAWSGVEPGCGPPRPLLGGPCAREGQWCFSASRCAEEPLGPVMFCAQGFWQEFAPTGECPIVVDPCSPP